MNSQISIKTYSEEEDAQIPDDRFLVAPILYSFTHTRNGLNAISEEIPLLVPTPKYVLCCRSKLPVELKMTSYGKESARYEWWPWKAATDEYGAPLQFDSEWEANEYARKILPGIKESFEMMKKL